MVGALIVERLMVDVWKGVILVKFSMPSMESFTGPWVTFEDRRHGTADAAGAPTLSLSLSVNFMLSCVCQVRGRQSKVCWSAAYCARKLGRPY
jgi:hypothetical protein